MVQAKKGSLGTRGSIKVSGPVTQRGGDTAPPPNHSQRFNKHKSNKRGA